MKPEPSIYIPPPEKHPADVIWLGLAIFAGVAFIAGMCLVAVEAAALYECVHRGICN